MSNKTFNHRHKDTNQFVGFARKVSPCSSLCNLCVLCASVVNYSLEKNHRDTENTEAAQRRTSTRDFSGKAVFVPLWLERGRNLDEAWGFVEQIRGFKDLGRRMGLREWGSYLLKTSVASIERT